MFAVLNIILSVLFHTTNDDDDVWISRGLYIDKYVNIDRYKERSCPSLRH